MRDIIRLVVLVVAFALMATVVAAQGGTGAIDLTARITPTGARPEPVRQFTLYVLTKSYAEIVKEVEAQDAPPPRDKFIEALKCSPELKTWLKAHDVLDLTTPDLDQVLTTDDIMTVPEFYNAYLRSNSGGVTAGFPRPKYREADREANPERYKKEKEEFRQAVRKFIESHPATVQGVELELVGVNPKTIWDRTLGDHKRRVAQLAPDTAQVKYLAGKAETDLDGRAVISGLAPGNYWVSSLGMDAASGDRRLLWDVPVKVQAGQTTHVDLTNLNATDYRSTAMP
ncbi:MAG TPA: hypothetical protein VEI54_08220 [Candidatus Limnocylindrales bacterium]|nr:hypothetical protein [Candidatus Limnocylindrales bacterium]